MAYGFTGSREMIGYMVHLIDGPKLKNKLDQLKLKDWAAWWILRLSAL